ncbi:hypothetical protein PSPO01_09848 [Paraphaeosphaeria sporulosa]
MHAISRGLLNLVRRLLKHDARRDFPTQGIVLTGSSWTFRVIAHLIHGCGNVQDNLFVPTDAIGGAANLEQEYAGRQYTVAPSDPGFVTHTSGSMNQNPLAQNPQDTYHFGSQHCMSTSSIWDERNMKYGYTPHRHTASFAQYHTRPCYAPRLAAEQYPADKYRDDEWQQEMIQSDQQREDEE